MKFPNMGKYGTYYMTMNTIILDMLIDAYSICTHICKFGKTPRNTAMFVALIKPKRISKHARAERSKQIQTYPTISDSQSASLYLIVVEVPLASASGVVSHAAQ